MIAFWSDRYGRDLLGEGPGDICVMNADGTGQMCITRDREGGDDVRPVWSPFYR
jgi:hypothetical protein